MLKIAKKPRVFASSTPIPAEGRAGMLNIAKNPKFLHIDHADLRRGARGHRKKKKKKAKNLELCTSTTPIPAEGRFS